MHGDDGLVVLVDTSIWINHFQRSRSDLTNWLLEDRVSVHPFVIEELALEHLKRRREVLDLIAALPAAGAIDHDEFLFFVEKHRLFSKGIGVVDIHLLATALLAKAKLATLDKKLWRVAATFGLI
jgi:predicted nucleic acid-binding protein